MKKYLGVFFAVAFIVAVVLVARHDKSYDASDYGYNIQCVQGSDPSSASASLACTIHSQKNADQSEAKPPWWHEFLAWPEGVTAWLLMLTLGAIVWQSYATANAAEAALLNARALINAERPWVFMAIEKTGQVIDVDFETLDYFTIKAVNKGRTPAAVLFIGEGVTVLSNAKSLPLLPNYVEAVEIRSPVMVAPDGYQVITQVDQSTLRLKLKNSTLYDAAKAAEARVYVFGKVLYRDVFAPLSESPHETRWCACFNFGTVGGDDSDDLFFVEGSSEYTRQT